MSTPKQSISLTTAAASSIGALMVLWIIMALMFGMRDTSVGTLVQTDAAEDVAATTLLADSGMQTVDAATDTSEVEPVETSVTVTARTVLFSADVPLAGDDADDVPPEERGCSH